ncbi:MAG TPA: type IVB secretion system protein IcmH/DotU [Stellaceae bacterium]|nr:type IVB secretion system protein IcmH/DotU [Stellaceae bacterium]
MTIDDPFAEPGDSERTVIRPNPGGRRPAETIAAAVAPPPLAFERAQPVELPPLPGLNPLVNAAIPLLDLAVQLKNRAVHNNVEALRDRVIAEINAFERRITPLGIAPQAIRASRYALCATIDDLVLNTPWGSRSIWAQKSMVGTFYSETWGGDRFFDLLNQLKKDAAVNLDMLELLYLCLTLGFEGKYRVLPRGASDLALLREDLYRTIRNRRGEFERSLSPHWQGVEAAHRGLGAIVPTWVVLVTALGILALVYTGLTFALSSRSDAAYAALNAVPPQGPVALARAAAPLPPPPPSDQTGKIRKFLEPEIRQGLVTVLEDAQTITIRIRGTGMFPSGSAVVEAKFLPLLGRIGEAVNTEPGPLLVTGHSDNVPIRSVKFPSNYELSKARAEAVLEILARKVNDPKRLTAEGRADSQPIAPNTTPQGREQNRRIEVQLMKAG